MHRYLHTATGPYSGRKLALHADQPTTIGRSHEATYPFFAETYMSRVHASIALSSSGCSVRDNDSTNGVFVEQRRVNKQAFLRPGQQLRVGETLFLLAESPIPVQNILQSPPLDAAQKALKDGALSGPLYAIVDAAQNDRIVSLLQDGHVPYQSLYEGPASENLGNIAPFLVSLEGPSAFLDTVIAEGWDHNWCVFMHCEASFPLVRRHLRRFLTVETESGKKLLFRFYDPRILEIFLETCDRDQLTEFFGPVSAFLTQTTGSWQIHKRLEGGESGDLSGAQHVSHSEPSDRGAWTSPPANQAAADEADPDRTRVHRSRGQK